ncbi:MAG TPA: hypothetical protein VMX15_04410 [Candidatus Heimdallarchaeota archaeon]|nr:hypothetical protein [Candidatus Heimdallarchaeota archaeon]
MTPREEKVLEALRSFLEKNDYSPSYAELADMAKLKSKSQAYYAITGLVSKGFVSRSTRRAHSIRVIEGVPMPPKKKGKRPARKPKSKSRPKIKQAGLRKDGPLGKNASVLITDDPFVVPKEENDPFTV